MKEYIVIERIKNFYNFSRIYMNHRAAAKCVDLSERFLLPEEIGNDLYIAKDVIGNFARANKAKVRFFRLNDDLEAADNGIKKVGIEVTKAGKNPTISSVEYSPESEIPFIRQVYEKLQSAIQGKESRIEYEKANTYLNLLRHGNIKLDAAVFNNYRHRKLFNLSTGSTPSCKHS